MNFNQSLNQLHSFSRDWNATKPSNRSAVFFYGYGLLEQFTITSDGKSKRCNNRFVTLLVSILEDKDITLEQFNTEVNDLIMADNYSIN